MTRNKARKQAARTRAAATGESYTAAARAVADPAGPPPFFKAAGGGVAWADLMRRLDEAESRLRDPDPYRRAAAFSARARVYDQLYAQTTSHPVFAAACLRSAMLDEESAAAIRFEHGIPTVFPQTEVQRLRLRRCETCGRPWGAQTEDACGDCPRLLFGPTPTTADEAASMAPPVPVVAAQLADADPVDD